MTSVKNARVLKWLSLVGVFIGFNLILLGVAHIQSAAMNPGYEPLVDVCLLIGGFVIGSFSYVAHRYYKSAAEPSSQLELEINTLLQSHENVAPRSPKETDTKDHN